MATFSPRLDLRRPYLIGIGGVGMSALAKILAQRGASVAGSDAQETAGIAALRRIGCDIHIGHDPKRVLESTCVVISQAIRETNVELRAAREHGLHVVHRAQALAEIMDGYRSVAVAGTHGKSSTATMLAVAFRGLGLNPSFAIGADSAEPGSNADHGTGDIFVAEADESDRSFHFLRPQIAIILNVEEDHHDNYSSLEEHLQSYELFAHGIQPAGTLVSSADDVGSRELASRLRKSAPQLNIVTYGEKLDASFRIVKIRPNGMESDVTVDGVDCGAVSFQFHVPGKHMAHNAVAAFTVGVVLGIDSHVMGEALTGYQGIQRRFTSKGEASGVLVVDSYAHHPTEITADLQTARQVVENSGRVVVIFQPHLPSRTQALGAEIGKALAAADLIILMDIYGGREDAIPGVTSSLVAQAARDAGALVIGEPRWSAVPEVVADHVRPGDLVLTMGAGDVTRLGPMILEEIKLRGAPS